MFKILLVNMPCANLTMPSIALTQLKSRVQATLQEKVSVEILYLNLEFGRYLGIDLYELIGVSMDSHNAGLGEWFFRQAAFPELPDNADDYFKRYRLPQARGFEDLKNSIIQKRAGIDAFLDELIGKYKMHEANIVGFTSMFMQNMANFAMARKLKQRNPAVVTVMGGANCEFPMGRVIARNSRCIDFIFSGPALKSFPDFVECQRTGDISKCDALRGVFSARNLPEAGPAILGEEMSIDVPVPLDYDSFLEEVQTLFPNGEIEPVLMFETSRGCWWGERAHCTFCGLNGASMNYRAMKPESAIEQFNSLFRYAGKVNRLDAVDNILPKQYVSQVLPYLRTPGNMTIFYEIKASLSKQDLAVLAAAGVKTVQPGIESLATSTLKLMRKGTTAFQNLSLLKNCALYDIHPEWNLLVGFPGEEEEVYRRYIEILPLMAHLPPPSGIYPVRFDRFSPYYEQRQSYGLDLHPLDFYKFIYPWSEADLPSLAYYFADRNIGAAYFKTMAQWIGRLRATVSEWRARWTNENSAPKLYLEKDSTKVFDSRYGAGVEHQVGEAGKALLKFLANPTRLEEIIKNFAPQEIDVVKEIDFLKQRRLLFQEADRFLSLVVDPEAVCEERKDSTPIVQIEPSARNSSALQPALVSLGAVG